MKRADLVERAARWGLVSYRYQFFDEKQLQDCVEAILQIVAPEYRREVSLSDRDRPDFMIDGIVIEVKIKGPFAQVLRQLHRYAQHDDVSGIILLTTKASHRRMPLSLNDKPIVVASLMDGAF